MTVTPAPSTAPAYSERLWPGPLGWGLVVAFAVLVGIALYPVGETLAVVTAGVVLLLGAVVAVRTTPRIAIVEGELWAGRAHIPVTLLGEVKPLDADETRVELGPALDARAFVCLRSWTRTAVRAEVVDPADTTPYWLVSTRRPHDLARAVGEARELPTT